jgi:outer membrane usher protein
MLAAASSQGRAATPDGLEPEWWQISLNGQVTEEPVLALRAPATGAIYLPLDVFRALHLKTGGAPTVAVDQTTYVPLATLGGLRFHVERDTQSLVLDADPGLFEQTRISYAADAPGPTTPSGSGGFLNYDLLVEHLDGRERASAALELGAFSTLGSGTTTGLADWTGRGLRIRRLETGWTIDDTDHMRSLRIGDAITRSGIGGTPFRFGGLQYGRSFDVQPGFITLPLASIQGSASLPSVVDVYVNDILQGRHKVRPGPFQIADLPVVTGGGEIELIVKDALGRQTILREPYYAARPLLRRGLHDFSYEAGFVRRNFGMRSADYGPFFVSGTHRYGLSNRLTAEAHVEAMEDLRLAELAASFAWPAIGLFTAGVSTSKSSAGSGALARIGFERRTPALSVGAIAEFASRDFVSIADLPTRARPASTIQAFAGVPLPFGSAALSFIKRDARRGPDVETISANASFRLGKFGTLNVVGSRSFAANRDTSIALSLSLPLGRRSYASAAVALRGGEASMRSGFQRNLPAGEGFGYSVAAAVGPISRVDARANLQSRSGTYGADLSWVDGTIGVRGTASGSVAMVDGQAFAARRLTQSFATVKVGHFADVRVYADNQLVGRTEANGIAIVPQLRPFESNPIRIELADLPMDAQVASDRLAARPGRRSGLAIDFGAARVRNAVLTLRLPDGTPLPAGAEVHVEGIDESFVVAPGGEVYLTGLKAHNRVDVRRGEISCGFDFALPETSDPQPRLGSFTCERL